MGKVIEELSDQSLCLGGCLTLAIWALYVGLIVAGAYYIIHNGLSLSLNIGR